MCAKEIEKEAEAVASQKFDLMQVFVETLDKCFRNVWFSITASYVTPTDAVRASSSSSSPPPSLIREVESLKKPFMPPREDPRTENSPHLGFIYTSFQERATFISHGKTARLAKEHGDFKLAQICGTIASDEKRRETAYTKIVEKLFEIDPDGTVMAFADMMRKKISLPAHLLYDGRDDNLFDHFSAVTQRLGVYTAKDYADVLELLVGRWKVEKLTGLSAEGRKAQDYVCGLPPRIRRLEESSIKGEASTINPIQLDL